MRTLNPLLSNNYNVLINNFMENLCKTYLSQVFSIIPQSPQNIGRVFVRSEVGTGVLANDRSHQAMPNTVTALSPLTKAFTLP